MFSKYLGDLCLSTPEYSRRVKCRGKTMQHSLPTNNVYGAFSSMAIPLPVPSPILPSNDRKNEALASNSPKGSPKPSAYQSQLLIDISSNEGPYNVSSSIRPPVIKENSSIRIEHTLGDQQHRLHRIEEQSAEEGSVKQERAAETLLSKATDLSSPPSVGSLDKFVSTLDAEHDIMQCLPPLVEELYPPLSTQPPETVEIPPISHSTGLENKTVIGNVTVSEYNQLESRGTSSPVTPVPAGAPWSQAGRGKALQQILSAESKPVGRLTPVVSPPFELHPKVSPVSVPNAESIEKCSNIPTRRTLRKAKVSLAIKFQGTAESPVSPATERKEGSPSILNCEPSNVNKTSPQGLMKPTDIVPSGNNRKIHSSEIQDQVPGREDQNLVVVGCKVSEGAMSAAIDSVETRASMLQSSEGKDGEFNETRAKRNVKDLEMSIAQHQRNIHQKMTELKRVQKRNKATADELEQELAEQCHREMMKHPHIKKANPEMIVQLDRLIRLQGQLVSQSEDIKRRVVEGELLLQQGRIDYDHDKLALKELELEVESSRCEEKLQLLQLEAQLLQAKTELLI